MIRPIVTDPAPWQFPLPVESRLSNGLDLWLTHMPGQQLMALELVIPTWLGDEPAGQEGVATVALQSSDEGTASYPEVVEELELSGAVLGGGVSWHHTSLSMSVPAERLADALPLFASIVREPTFASDRVAHHVETLRSAWERRQAAPAAAAPEHLRRAMFGSGVREGRELAGRPETLETIDSAAVRAWHRATWRPEGATLIVAGDLTGFPHEVLAEAFAGWVGPAASAAPAAARTLPARVVVVDHPGAAQTAIQVAVPTPGRRHEDWAALRLGGHAMAGAFSSRLNLELRERLSYTYGVSGGTRPRHREGWVNIAAAVANESAVDSVARIRRHLALEEAFTAEEVADCRRFLVQVSPLRNETAADIAQQSAALAVVGEPVSYVNELSDALAAVPDGEVTAAWHRWVRPQDATIVLVGPAACLIPELTAAGIAAVTA